MKGYGFYLVILAIVFITVFLSDSFESYNQNAYNRSQFISDLEQGRIAYVDIYPNQEVYTGKVKVKFTGSGSKGSFYASDIREIESLLIDADIKYDMHDISKPNWFLSTVLPYVLVFIVVIALFSFLSNQASVGGGNNKVMNFGKSRAKMTTGDNKTTTFKNVAGLDEEKDELKEIVDFLKSPKKYIQVGARIPKGVLLVDLPERVKPFLPKLWQEKQGYRSFLYPALILWKCL